MLNELYRYAVDHGVPYRAGFVAKKPDWYLWITGDGKFQDILPAGENIEEVLTPDVGSLANGTEYCNPLIEKASILLGISLKQNAEKKREFFLRCLEDGSRYEPLFGIAARALENEAFRTAAIRRLEEEKIKRDIFLGLCVDGQALEKRKNVSAWWEEYRKTVPQLKNQGERSICLITGRTAPAMLTAGKVKGLMRVGGHAAGDSFLCFDKDAFQSFGWKQGDNASVSEEAMAAVNAALKRLIEKAPILGGAKIVHWYSGEVPEEEDVLLPVFEGYDLSDAITDGGEESGTTAVADGEREKRRREKEAMQKAKALLDAVRNGERPELGGARYYIMPLSGAGGRMMVRSFEEGSFSELSHNVDLWFDDMRLAMPNGRGETGPEKLSVLMTRLLKPKKEDGKEKKGKRWQKENDRINTELCGLDTCILNAAVNGAPLPDEVAVRALRWLRSAMLSSGGEETSGEKTRKTDMKTETIVYQWLKIWLRRRQRMKGAEPIMGERIDPNYPGVPYQCGRMMAVYAKIQETALEKDVGAGVVERYYAAASRTPALVLGRLSQLGTYHLAKIAGADDKKGLGIYYKRILEQIASAIGERPVPKMFSVEQQTEFALGYYHQLSDMYKKEEIKNGD